MSTTTPTPASRPCRQRLEAPCRFERAKEADRSYLVRYTFPTPSGSWDPSRPSGVHSVWETASEAWEAAEAFEAETGALCHLQLLREEWAVPRGEVFEVVACCMEAYPEDVELDRALAADGWDFEVSPALSCLWDRAVCALLEGLREATLTTSTFLVLEEAVAWAYSEEEAAIEEEVWAALQ